MMPRAIIVVCLALGMAGCGRPKEKAVMPTRPVAEATPMMQPGLERPPVQPAGQAGLPDDTPVLGVVVAGHARAYAVPALSKMLAHVVNDLVDDVPVSVTYCDRTDCARVFTDATKGKTLPLGQGGFWDGLLLTAKGKFYRQESGKTVDGKDTLPYRTLPFERSTWKAWRQKHPDTEVFSGTREDRPADG